MADSDSGEHTHTPATTESPSSPATTVSPTSPTVIRDRLLLLSQQHQQQQAVFRIHVFLGIWIRIHYSEVWIRILLWIRIRILPALSKYSKKNLDFYCFVTSF